MADTKQLQDEGIEALRRLIVTCRRHRYTGGTLPLLEFLGALYNDEYAPSIWDICTCTDEQDFLDVMQVMRLVRRTRREPHLFIVDGSSIWATEILKGLRRHRARPSRKKRY